MNRVTILITSDNADDLENFELNGVSFEFHNISCDEPTVLIEGAAWVFVDWIMPALSGLEMCRRLRTDPRTRDAHITMILSEEDPEYRGRALKAGADDYIAGPVDRQAIVDRIRALQPLADRLASSRVIETGSLHLNVDAEQARWKNRRLTLRPNEFRLLRFMVEHPNRILSRREIIGALGKSGDPDCVRTVDVWMKRLRCGLRQVGAVHLLRTVRNKGYVFDEP